MKTQLWLFIAFAMLIACNNEDKNSLEAKKTELVKLEKKADDLHFKIKELRAEIEKLDTANYQPETGKLVNIEPLEIKHFRHYIEMQGNAQSKENVLILPEASGVVKQILVSEGQNVSKGQTLIVIDDELITKQLDELKTQYELALTIFNKQQSLWEQNIGSEVQFLEAKNRKETLEKTIGRIESQLAKYRVQSPINGTVDEILINTGELASPGRQVIRVVNLEEIQIHADAPETYVGSIRKGDSVQVNFPAVNINRQAVILAVGQVINPINRTFGVDVKISNADKTLKANLMAILKVADYENKKALTVPTKWIQQDHNEDFVFVAVMEEGVKVARKQVIEKGRTYGGETEIISGLKAGDILITEGSRDITDGEFLRYAK